MTAFAQLWRKPGNFRLFRRLKVCATMMCGYDVTRSGGFQPPIPYGTALPDDDGICATMAENRHLSTFQVSKSLRNYGGTVAAASSRRCRMISLFDDDGICATMGVVCATMEPDRIHKASVEYRSSLRGPPKHPEKLANFATIGQVPYFIGFFACSKLANDSLPLRPARRLERTHRVKLIPRCQRSKSL